MKSHINRSNLQRRGHGGRGVAARTRSFGGDIFAPANKLSPLFPTRKAAKGEFSAVISDIAAGDLATSADVSKETVKCWRKGRGFPVGDRLMDLMGDFPIIRDWVIRKTGEMPGGLSGIEHMQLMTPQFLAVLLAAAHQVAQQNNPDGEAVRKAISKLKGRE